MSIRTPIFPLLLAACTLRPYEYGESATGTTSTTDTTTTTTTTTLPTTTTSTSTTLATGPDITATAPTTTDDLTTTGSPCNSFICPPDLVGGGLECDIWEETCPEGQKCMPYSGDGDNSWESLKCSPVVPNPDAPGEPCTVVGSGVSGEDSCEKHAMCWDPDPDTLIGTCVAFCTGPQEAATCKPKTQCSLGRTFSWCYPICDPLLQDCPGEDLCIPNPNDPGSWICVLDASGDEGQVFDVCEYINACDPGLMCQDPVLATECDPMALGCCLPFCDVTLPNTCPGQAQECLPWYEQGMEPPANENVGLCGIPQP